jgi:tetratricopeptide (TPR) repeat protein
MPQGWSLPKPARYLVGASALWFALAPAPVRAQGDETMDEPPSLRVTEAQRRFAEGAEAYQSGEFERARLAFEQAYALEPLPVLLLNLGQAEFRTGHYVQSARHLAAALREAEVRRAEREAAERTLREAEKQVGRVQVSANTDGAAIAVDGETVGSSPMLYVWHVEPGEHQLRVTKEGFEGQTTQFGVSKGQLKEMEVALLPSNAALGPDSNAPPQGDGGREDASAPNATVAIVGASLAVIGLGAGTYFLLSANGKRSDRDAALNRALESSQDPTLSRGNVCLSASPVSDSAECRKAASLNDDQKSHQTLGFVGLGVGVAVGAATAAYWLWPREQGAAEASLRITPLYAPGFTGVSVGGSL